MIRATLILCLVASGVQAATFQVIPTIPTLEILGPDGPTFATAFNMEAGGAPNGSLASPLSPYSFRITNRAPKAIRYYVVRYDHLNPQGVPIRTVIRVSNADFKPGTSQFAYPMEGVGASLRSSAPPVNHVALSAAQKTALSRLAASPFVTAKVDAVVYDDGEFVGPDTTATFSYLDTFSSRLQAFLRELTTLLPGPSAVLHQRLEKAVNQPSPFHGLETAAKSDIPPSASNERSFASALSDVNAYNAEVLIASTVRRLLATDSAAIPVYLEQQRNWREFSPVWRAK